jgi:hypothetical protein
LLAAVPSVRAQQLGAFVRVTADNDQFNFWRAPGQRPDEDYSQGLRLEWQSRRVPSGIRTRLCATTACASNFQVGQEIYTPVNDAPQPIPGERPYAGWLYGRGSFKAATHRHRGSFSAVVGVTGPASLAEQVQTSFHHLYPKYRQPMGWAYQLPTEVSFGLSADKEWFMRGRADSPHWTDLEPRIAANVGTLKTAVEGRALVRAGWHLSHPWLVDSARFAEVYLFAGPTAEFVARDLFLDGTTFQESVSVERVPFVASWERGINARLGRVTLGYRAVTTSHRYKTQPVSHTFGRISLAISGSG